MVKRIVQLLLAITATLQIQAAYTNNTQDSPISPLTENATISLLTSGPSDMAIFTVWGHTAIRVKDPEIGIDKVFNYGIFSFGEPLSFVARFVSGQTDYRLGRTSMLHSMEETIEKNADYYEQVLNLTQSEKEHLYGALLENYKPENRVYRYKYFSDNCATRPRALIHKCIEGELVYSPYSDNSGKSKEAYQSTYTRLFNNEDGTTKTYRDIIYELLPTSPWYRFGIDLCLGQPTDTKIGSWDNLFLPIYLKEEVSYQSIRTGDSIRPLVKETNKLLDKEETTNEKEWTETLNPSVVFWAAVILAILHVLYYTKSGKDDRWAYLVFYGTVGLVGSIIFYVSCISVHEFVFPNYNLLWISPLQLAIAILIYIKKAERIETALMSLSGIGCIMGLLYFVICKTADHSSEMQQYNNANMPAILIQLILTLAWLWRKKKNRV